ESSLRSFSAMAPPSDGHVLANPAPYKIRRTGLDLSNATPPGGRSKSLSRKPPCQKPQPKNNRINDASAGENRPRAWSCRAWSCLVLLALPQFLSTRKEKKCKNVLTQRSLLCFIQ